MIFGYCYRKELFIKYTLVLLVSIMILLLTPACSQAQELVRGDVNGDGRFDVRDVTKVMRHILDLQPLDQNLITYADVNNDGTVNVRDASLIMQYSLDLIGTFNEKFKLGNEVLMESRRYLVDGKKVGLITNQSGVDSRGISTIDKIAADPDIDLVALYGPEHGIDGKAAAGEYVECYTHPDLEIPVYSLYGSTRMPREDMLSGLDLLLFDVQDIGARSYTYISTLNYCMVAARDYDLPVIVLDRPNPLGGRIVDGPMLEEPYISFVGIDILPMAHGMTVGEVARYFNRNIGADLTVVSMEGYNRDMVFQDTGLSWVQTSPNIPDIDSVFGYMIAGMGENTGIFQAEQFKWIGGRGLDSDEYAATLNSVALPGVEFIPEQRGEAGGVRIRITDYHQVNPARTGIYALTLAFDLADFNVPRSTDRIVMFELIMGSAKMGEYLDDGLTPQQIEANYTPALNDFREERKKYLLSQYGF